MACIYEEIKYEDFNGDFDTYYKQIKALFDEKIIKKPPFLYDKKVVDEDKLWHIISDGINENERTINFNRAKFINLFVNILSLNKECFNNCKEILYFEKVHYGLKHKRQTRAYLLCPIHNYLIILQKRNFVYSIVTAFPIEHSYKIEKYKEDYELYKKKREPI